MLTLLNNPIATAVKIAPDLAVRPIQLFGAQVVLPADIAAMTSEHIRALRVTLLEHKMLLIRNRKFTPEEQMVLTQIFGSELHSAGPSLRYLPDYPEIFRISNQHQHGNKNTGQYWHCDGHYLADPSAISVMHIVRATADGDTCVVDSEQAYDRLPENLKAHLKRHCFANPETKVAHPIVRPHPLTKRLGLYVNLNAVAMNPAFQPNPAVSEMLNQYFWMPGNFYRHKWQEGDTMILDNFSAAHTGTFADPKELRVMHRTTVTGPSVWWRN
jgi:taurine dioxygenase